MMSAFDVQPQAVVCSSETIESSSLPRWRGHFSEIGIWEDQGEGKAKGQSEADPGDARG